jgi:ribonuclease III
VSILDIFSSTKLSEHEKRVSRLMSSVFEYKPVKMHYFVEALTHKSFTSKEKDKHISNERLEFLGDAIIDAAVAEYVFFKFPEEPEGYLTKVKSKLVNRKTLSELGSTIGIESVLLYDNSRPINLDSLQGNAFEAIIGAVYLDGGYIKAKSCLLESVFPRFLDINKVLEEEIDFKSKLMIWAQRNKIHLEFSVLDSKQAAGEAEHIMVVRINGTAYGRGKASSKKAAEQLAAKETLVLIGEIE